MTRALALSAALVVGFAGAAGATRIPDRLGSHLDGSPVASADFRGKVLLVSLWASWCGPCTRELPHLETLQGRYEAGRVVVLALNVGESRHEVEAFLREHTLSLLVARDPYGKVGRQIGTRGLPAHVLVDADGVVCSVLAGGDPEVLARIQQRIDRLVAGGSCADGG